MTKQSPRVTKPAKKALEEPQIKKLEAPSSVRRLSAFPVLADKAEWLFPWIKDMEEHDRVMVYEHCREGLRVADLVLRANGLMEAADNLARRIIENDLTLAAAGLDDRPGMHMASMLYLMSVHKESGVAGLLPPPAESCRELLGRHYSIISEGRGPACSLRLMTADDIENPPTKWSIQAQPKHILTLNNFAYPLPKLSEVIKTVRKQLKGKVQDDMGGRPPADLLFLSQYRYSMGKRRLAVSHGKSFVDELLACRSTMTETAAALYAGCLGYEKPMIADKTWYSGVRTAGRRVATTAGLIIEKVVKP